MIFETSLLETTGRGKLACATLFSAAGQSTAAAVLILLSIAHTEMITIPRLAAVIGSPGPTNMAVRQRAAPTAPATATPNRIFTIPVLTYASSKAPAYDAGFDDAPLIGMGAWSGQERSGFHPGDFIGILPAAPRHVEAVKPAPVQKAAETAPKRITVSTGVQSARLTHQVQPVYPPLARQARIQGTVRLLAVITAEGRIQSLRAESGHPLLVPAAIDAVQQWRYRPTMLNDQPVEVVTQIQVVFTLTQ